MWKDEENRQKGLNFKDILVGPIGQHPRIRSYRTTGGIPLASFNDLYLSHSGKLTVSISFWLNHRDQVYRQHTLDSPTIFMTSRTCSRVREIVAVRFEGTREKNFQRKTVKFRESWKSEKERRLISWVLDGCLGLDRREMRERETAFDEIRFLSSFLSRGTNLFHRLIYLFVTMFGQL